jgi:hypothetical protein
MYLLTSRDAREFGTRVRVSRNTFALLWTSALFRWHRRRLEGGLAWRPTRFADRQADRTGAPRALSVATQQKVHGTGRSSIARDIIDRSGRLPEHAVVTVGSCAAEG